MKLLKVELENYRCHRNLEVKFTGNPFLITGPNESGKSTLIEAIHRAFFLRFKSGGQVVENMRSVAGGVPRVAITFQTKEGTFTLRKEFLGARSSAVLEQPHAERLNGDTAEKRLAEILGVSGPISGGGASGGLEKRWAHLWVWQGRSGLDPTQDLAESREALLARLQSHGAVGVLQSGLDRRVQDRLIEEVNSLLKAGAGEPRANTRWASLRAEVDRLKEREERLRQEVEALGHAMNRKRDADQALARLKPTLAQEEEALQQARRKRDEIAGLRQKLSPIETEIQANQVEIKRLVKQMTDLAEAESVLPRLTQAQADCAREQAEADGASKYLEKQLAVVEVSLAQAQAEAEHLRRRRDLALAESEVQRAEADLNRLEERRCEVAKVFENLRTRQDQLSALPVVTPTILTELDQLQDVNNRAEAAVNAVAAEVQVIRANDHVTIGGQIVLGDEELRFTGPFEIQVGDRVELRISPGGGASLDQAVAARDGAAAALGRALAECCVASVAEAREILIRRQMLEQEIRAEEKQLKVIGAETIERDRAAAAQALVQAKTRAEAIRKEISGEDVSPADDNAVREAETKVQRLAQERKTLLEQLDEAKGRLFQAVQAVVEANQSLRNAETRRATLIEMAGPADALARRREELEQHLEELRSQAIHVQAELEALGAATIEEEVEMREKAVTHLNEKMKQQTLVQVEAQTLLFRDGSHDPVSELAAVQAKREAAQEAEAQENTRVSALAYLLHLFQEVEATSREKFTEPLVERVNAYVRPVFGASAKVAVTYDGSFAGLFLDRSSSGKSRFAFDQLSGGAREQLSVAFRLAVAEILAADHDGCLPIVLDDALVSSDSTRIKQLQIMLNRAVRQGIQVILTTCTPEIYAGLGAATFDLGNTHPALPGNKVP
ncbi:MAG: AAA family ATPase [Candidatus Methylacidiphilales bacterium]